MSRIDQFSHRSDDGFILIEFVVAFAVLTIGISALLSGANESQKSNTRSNFAIYATVNARSKLESATTAEDMQSRFEIGNFADGTEWRLSRTLLRQISRAQGQPLNLVRIDIEVLPPRATAPPIRMTRIYLSGGRMHEKR